MSKHSAAQKAQETASKMTIVEPTAKEQNAKVINFKSSVEEVPSEAVTEQLSQQAEPKELVTITEVIQKVNEAYNARPDTPTPVQETKPLQSIEDIKRKSEVLTRLSKKYDDLQEKRKRVENFQISHDNDSASVQVYDANGEAFESHSPKTIGKLIEFWLEEFTEAIATTENQMREIA